MDQKIQFLAEYHRKVESFSQLCEDFGISRKTGYKWLNRFVKNGASDLEDRSKAAGSHPNQTPGHVVEALLEGRQQHGSWGARKLLWFVHKCHPDWELPHPSTVCDILNRFDMVRRQRPRRRPGHPGRPTTPIQSSNIVWSADFKGQFRMGNGEYCYPLTMTDNFSRFLLCCQGMAGPKLDETQKHMTRTFREYGLPERIRTDNGGPFASEALGRLSRLSAWWIRLGIIPEFIELGKPQQNGRHERMHKTLKDETTRPPGYSLRSQQEKFNIFRREYNNERPHESLDMEPPATYHQLSRREYPTKLKTVEYPAHFEVRYVSANGGIRWNRDWVNVSSVCKGDYVGLEETGDGIWTVYYSFFKLGYLHERHMRIEDVYGKLVRK